MKLKYVFIIAMAVSVFASCGKITEEEGVLKLQSLPVVFSVISPLNPVQVSLSKTIVPNGSNDTIYYPSARVYVCGDDKVWTELSRESLEVAVYKDVNNKIKVTEGKTYFLRVDIAGTTVSAQTTVPIQKGKIVAAEFIADSEQSPDFDRYLGTLTVKLELNKTDPYVLTAYADYIGSDYSTFLQQSSITDRISIPDSVSAFNLHLITFDPYLAKYWAAKAIASQQDFSEGDLSVFIGTFNGLLPPYSNIVNGVGLFGSYAADTKNVKVAQP